MWHMHKQSPYSSHSITTQNVAHAQTISIQFTQQHYTKCGTCTNSLHTVHTALLYKMWHMHKQSPYSSHSNTTQNVAHAQTISIQFTQHYYTKCGTCTNNLHTNTQDFSDMKLINRVRCSWHNKRLRRQHASRLSSSWHSEGQWHHHVSRMSVVIVVKEAKRSVLVFRYSQPWPAV